MRTGWVPVLVLLWATPGVYFTPGGRADRVILNAVMEAEESVYVAGFRFSWEELAAQLRDLKYRKKVDIRVVLDSLPSGRILAGLRNNIRQHPGGTLFHAKFVIVDGRRVIAGSVNFAPESFLLDRNDIVLLEDRELAGFFKERFLCWWKDADPGVTKPPRGFQRPVPEETGSDDAYRSDSHEVFFGPQHDCEKEIRVLLSRARETIRFAQYEFTSDEVAETVVLRKLAGVDVRGVLERTTISPYSVFYFLRDCGCDVRRSNLAGLIHHKFFVVDGRTVITGSYNPTRGARKNQECVVVIRDAETARRYLAAWTRIWRWGSVE